MTAQTGMQLDVRTRSSTVHYQTQTEKINGIHQLPTYLQRSPPSLRSSLASGSILPFLLSLSYQKRVYIDMTLLSAGLVVSGTRHAGQSGISSMLWNETFPFQGPI